MIRTAVHIICDSLLVDPASLVLLSLPSKIHRNLVICRLCLQCDCIYLGSFCRAQHRSAGNSDRRCQRKKYRHISVFACKNLLFKSNSAHRSERPTLICIVPYFTPLVTEKCILTKFCHKNPPSAAFLLPAGELLISSVCRCCRALPSLYFKYFSNHSIISVILRILCFGLPLLESSWFSPWKRHMRASTPKYFNAGEHLDRVAHPAAVVFVRLDKESRGLSHVSVF